MNPKLLFVGLGSAGRRHWRNYTALQAGESLLYRTGRSTLPTDEFDHVPTYHSLEQALEQRPTAAVIANPTALHLSTAMQCAEAGCHLLIEKPVAHSLEGMDEFAELTARRGLHVLVGYQYRFHPALRTIRTWLDDGQVGTVASVRVVWGEYLPLWHPWEDHRRSYAARRDLGGGVVLTLSHPLDYLRWLFGEVTDLLALTSARGGLGLTDVEDIADILLRFASGVQANLHVDYLRQQPLHTLEIVGADGTITWDNNDGIARLYRDGEIRMLSVPPVDFERNQMFRAEMEHFLAILRGEAQPLCTLDDGIAALRLALQAGATYRP